MVSIAVTPKLNRTPDSGSRSTLTSTAEFDEEWSTRNDGYGFAYDRTCKSPVAVFSFDVQPKSALALTKTTSTTTPIESFTRDPIGFEGSEWNLYELFAGAPFSYVDPYGLQIGFYPKGRPTGPGGPRIPGGPPLSPGAPPPKVSYQDGLNGLDAIGPMIAGMCDKCCNQKYCDCMGDAAKIRDALKDTWTQNYGYGPLGPNRGPGDDSVGGFLCWEWANMFSSALTRLMLNSGCMSFHRMATVRFPAIVPRNPMHAWVRISIGNGGPGCEANADDGWGNGSSSNTGIPLGNPGGWIPPIVYVGPFEGAF